VPRILYFTIPFLAVFISNVFLLSRNLRVHQNRLLPTFPKRTYLIIVVVLALLGLATIGIYEVIHGLWRVKEWIFFGVLCVLNTIAPLIFTADTHATTLISGIVVLITAIGNEWFFIELRDLPIIPTHAQATDMKHVDRNIVGFIEALLIVLFYTHVLEYLRHGLNR